MNEAAELTNAQRRLTAGLSPSLLSHAASGQNFLGFISYRRGDGLELAKWLRDRITSFQAPPELRDKIAAIDALVGGKQNRVFFDMSYQRPNVDFWDEHIAASLCRSRTLILLQTPSVFDRLDNGEANWCEREIETYLKYYGDPTRILVVMAPGAPIDKFPEPLAKISSRWDWVDLRFFSESALSRLRHGGLYDPLLSKILAKIYDISDGDLPLLNREFAKARARIRRALAIAASVAIISLSALTVWALVERDKANVAEQIAVMERNTAIEQRNGALISQSRFLANSGDELTKIGTTRAAIALLREALPDKAAGRERPLVNEAIASAYKAIYADLERGRLDLPSGVTVVASAAKAELIVMASKDRLFVRKGLTAEDQRDWPHDLGEVRSLGLSADNERAVMIAPGGTVVVHETGSDRVLLRHGGEGAGTRAGFLRNGKRLLISDASQSRLHLLDVDTGVELASRVLTLGKDKPIVSLIDADSDFIALVANNELMRLSPDDLSDLAVFPIDDAEEYALALTPDKASLYLAAAKHQLDGHLVELDALTLTPKRTFARIVWGARGMSLQVRWNLLALHGRNGVDFFDLNSGERLVHVSTSFGIAGGHFMGKSYSSDYVVFGTDGSIRRLNPTLGLELMAYTTIDGGAIQDLVALPDNNSFLSISDHPSITHWNFEGRKIAREYSIPLIVRGLDLEMLTSINASEYNYARHSVLAAYASGSIMLWKLDASAPLVLRPESRLVPEIKQVTQQDNGLFLAVDAAGLVRIFKEENGAGLQTGEFQFEPLSALTGVSRTKSFALTAKNQPILLDFTDIAKPLIQPLPELGDCPYSVAIPDFAICLTKSGQIRALRISDHKLVLDSPKMPGTLTAGYVSEKGQTFAISDERGHVWLLGLDNDRANKELMLQDKLSGAYLHLAADRGWLSQQNVELVRNGAKRLDAEMGANKIALASDGTHAAFAMPSGLVKLTDLKTGVWLDIHPNDRESIAALEFSAHGQLLGVIVEQDYRVLRVYDVASGDRLASISLSDVVRPTLYPQGDGRGFVVIDDSGKIMGFPMFEQTGEFIAYLKQKFPDTLTPLQRRNYFLE